CALRALDCGSPLPLSLPQPAAVRGAGPVGWLRKCGSRLPHSREPDDKPFPAAIVVVSSKDDDYSALHLDGISILPDSTATNGDSGLSPSALMRRTVALEVVRRPARWRPKTRLPEPLQWCHVN